jgi:predicted transcriptional regulator
MGDILREIKAETWRAASVKAFERAGEHVSKGEYDKAIEWQTKAFDYARRGYIQDSKA